MSSQLDIFTRSEREPLADPQTVEAPPNTLPVPPVTPETTAGEPASRSDKHPPTLTQLTELPGTTFQDIFTCQQRVLIGHNTRRQCNGPRGHKGPCW